MRKKKTDDIAVFLGRGAGYTYGAALIFYKALLFFSREAVSIFVSYPIFALELVSLIFHGWSWLTALLLPLSLTASFYVFSATIQSPLARRATSQGSAVIDLANFFYKFERTQFSLVDNGALVSSLLGEEEARARFPEMFGENFYKKNILRGAFASRKKLRFVLLKDEGNTDAYCPLQIVTFASWSGAWIFLTSKTEDLTGLQKFQILHELGHLSFGALARDGSLTPRYLQAMVLSSPLLLLRAGNVIAVFGLLLGVIAIELLELQATRELAPKFRLLDEIEADRFAFSYSKKAWFKDYPATEVAERLCRDGRFTPDETQMRVDAFVTMLGRLRGEEGTPRFREDPIIPTRHHKLMSALFGVTSAMLFWCGTFYSHPSGIDILGFALAILVFRFLFQLAIASATALEAMVTVNVRGVAKIDALTESAKSVRKWLLFRGRHRPKPYEKMTYRLITQYLGLVDHENEMKDIEKIHRARDQTLAPGTSATLFAPGEARIFLKKTLPPQPYIIYEDRRLGRCIERLEYHSEEQWVRVHFVDGDPMTLGVEIGWRTRPFWEDAPSVGIIRASGREIMEQLTVPLQIVNS